MGCSDLYGLRGFFQYYIHLCYYYAMYRIMYVRWRGFFGEHIIEEILDNEVI